MSAIDNTDRIQREVNFCKSEVPRFDRPLASLSKFCQKFGNNLLVFG